MAGEEHHQRHDGQHEQHRVDDDSARDRNDEQDDCQCQQHPTPPLVVGLWHQVYPALRPVNQAGPPIEILQRVSAPYTSELAASLAGDLLRRFDRYVRIDTQSARDRTRSPSTPGQLDLARVLVEELTAAGLTDATLDDNGYVMA